MKQILKRSALYLLVITTCMVAQNAHADDHENKGKRGKNCYYIPSKKCYYNEHDRKGYYRHDNKWCESDVRTVRAMRLLIRVSPRVEIGFNATKPYERFEEDRSYYSRRARKRNEVAVIFPSRIVFRVNEFENEDRYDEKHYRKHKKHDDDRNEIRLKNRSGISIEFNIGQPQKQYNRGHDDDHYEHRDNGNHYGHGKKKKHH